MKVYRLHDFMIYEDTVYNTRSAGKIMTWEFSDNLVSFGPQPNAQPNSEPNSKVEAID